MNSCSHNHQAIAACAVGEETPSDELLAHLEQCPACRAELNSLQSAAALQSRAAARLPAPKRELPLEQWFRRTIVKETAARPRYTRILAVSGAAVMAFLAIIIAFSYQKNEEPQMSQPVIKGPEMAHVTAPATSEDPTWQNFRQAMSLDSPGAFRFESAGTVVSHYRLKDRRLAEEGTP